jgi:hypothetical protein
MSMIVLGASPWRVGVLVAGLIVLGSPTVYSAEFTRVEWSPGGGFVGDVWTFRCPAGGSVFASADAFADRPVGENAFESALDLVLEVFEGQGNPLAASDDDVECAAPIACGGGCPVLEVQCGRGLTHSRVVRDAGVLEGCDGGGAYLLILEVTSEAGQSLPNSEVKLGGGVTQNVPPWIRRQGVAGRRGPVLNDGPVPLVAEPEGALGAQASRTK